eukprot:m.238207 g.238207  ORF g.238207 m.238207 type:complete len:423 (+) comp21661_c0_seq1:153-1421(+)
MSTFGTYFRVSTFGESHCAAVGVVIDGCPPRLPLDVGDIQTQLSRRRPGQSALTTQRKEEDLVTILSGTERGLTLGTPIALMVANKDQKPGDYSSFSPFPRPSHADWSYLAKYGVKASSGGGRSSARETVGRVAAGAVAEHWLRLRFGVEIVAWVSSVGIEMDYVSEEEMGSITRAQVDTNTPVRCAHGPAVERLAAQISTAKADRDSIGGVVTCVVRGVPAGWGEPVFDKLEALLAHAMLSIPATKGFEVGSGFAGTRMRGSVHNDLFEQRDGQLHTTTNRSGGIQGGISNGEPLYFSVAFKPPATIGQPQATCTYNGEAGTLEAHGRHDPCVVPRAVPIVEAMAALVLADVALAQLAREAAAPQALFPTQQPTPAAATAAVLTPPAPPKPTANTRKTFVHNLLAALLFIVPMALAMSKKS